MHSRGETKCGLTVTSKEISLNQPPIRSENDSLIVNHNSKPFDKPPTYFFRLDTLIQIILVI